MTTIAIVGGGFTGAAVAYHLAAHGAAARIVVFEPRERLGAGSPTTPPIRSTASTCPRRR